MTDSSLCSVPSPWRRWAPWLALAGVLLLAAIALRLEGRPWWCACREPTPFALDPTGPHNSQHLFDPYSLTHFVKGLFYCGLLFWALPKVPWTWRLILAVGLEAAWEVIENSPPVIERYRTATIAAGYQGDTLVNSLGDIASSGVGFLLARRLGLWWSATIVVATEVLVLLWIRDNLTLATVMLVIPLDSVKTWQTGG